VQLGKAGGDRVTIGSFCASATQLDGPPPPPPPVQPVVTNLHCESLTARYSCDLSFTDSTGTTVTVRWHINGTRIAALNDLRSINRSCSVATTVSVRVVVANATGGSVQRTASVPCLGGAT
jgi:hypothetical protein